jgi:hypothetical protein
MATQAVSYTQSPFPSGDGTGQAQDEEEQEPKMPQFDPGELAPFWASPHEPAQLS